MPQGEPGTTTGVAPSLQPVAEELAVAQNPAPKVGSVWSKALEAARKFIMPFVITVSIAGIAGRAHAEGVKYLQVRLCLSRR